MTKKLQVDEDDFKKLVKDVEEIKIAMVGNKQMGIIGMAEKVASHGKYIQQGRKMRWIVTGAAAGGNVGFWVWIKTHFGI